MIWNRCFDWATLNMKIPHSQQQMEAFLSLLSQSRFFIVCLASWTQFPVNLNHVTCRRGRGFLGCSLTFHENHHTVKKSSWKAENQSGKTVLKNKMHHFTKMIHDCSDLALLWLWVGLGTNFIGLKKTANSGLLCPSHTLCWPTHPPWTP